MVGRRQKEVSKRNLERSTKQEADCSGQLYQLGTRNYALGTRNAEIDIRTRYKKKEGRT